MNTAVQSQTERVSSPDVARFLESAGRGGGFEGRPRLGRFVLRRPALVAELDQAVDAQVVLLRGPSGAGKTATVTDWADCTSQRGDRLGAWYAVEAGDDQRQHLWRTVLARLGIDVVAAEDDEAVRSILLALPEIATVIVLDDVDRIVDQRIFDDVEWILQRRVSLTFILLSRGRTRFEDPAVRSRLDVEVVDVRKLLMSKREAAAALSLRGISFDTGALERLYREFGGAPFAVNRSASHLVLEGKRVWREKDIGVVVLRIHQELAEELVASVRVSGYWPVLRASAVLPYLRISLLAQFLDDDAAAREVLSVAERAGLGRWRRQAGQDRFTFSRVARQALLTALENRDADTIAKLQSMGARMLDEDGETMDSLRMALACQDWRFFSDTAFRNYARLTRDNFTELAALLDEIPADFRQADPWILHLRGALAFAADGPWSAQAAALFDEADTAARDQMKEATGSESVRLASLRMVSLRRLGSFGRATIMAKKVIELLETPALARRDGASAFFAEARVQSGVTLLHDGLYGDALRQFSKAERDPSAPSHVRIQSLGYSALVHAIRGEIQASVLVMTRARADDAWKDWRHSIWAIPGHLAAAINAIELGDHRDAAMHTRALSQLTTHVEEWPLLAYVQGMARLVLGDGYASFSAIRDLEGRADQQRVSSHFQGLLFAVKSDLLLLAKQARSALALLRPLLDGRETVVGAQARALLFSGSDTRARLFVERYSWRENLSPRTAMELQVVKAVAANRLGDPDAAAEALERACSIGTQHDLRLPWSFVPHDELHALIKQSAPHLRPLIEGAPQIYTSALTVPTLTRRETIVLAHLRGPGALDVIAKDLMVSPNTIKSQVQSIYRKLGVSARADAIRVAFEWRLTGAGAPSESGERQFAA